MSVVELNSSVYLSDIACDNRSDGCPLVLPLCFLYRLVNPSHGLSNKVSGFTPPQFLGKK